MEIIPTSNPGVFNAGLVKVVNAEGLAAADAEREALQGSSQPEPTVISELTAHLNKLWVRARDAKRDIEDQMLRSLRQRYGVYDPDKLASIREMGGSEVYMLLTLTKCRACEAWVNDVLRPSSDKNFVIRPTPIAELPPDKQAQIEQDVFAVRDMVIQQFMSLGIPINWGLLREEIQAYQEELYDKTKIEIQNEARKRAERMTKKIEDELVEGGWHSAFWASVQDLITLKVGIIKGPVLRRKKVQSWVQGEDGTWGIDMKEKIIKTYERVSPFDVYPAPDSSGTEDGYLFQRHRLTRGDLVSMIGVPGYSEDAIRQVLDDYDNGRMNHLPIDTELNVIHKGNTDGITYTDKIEALEFWGSLQGKHLQEWGIDGVDPQMEYEVNAWKVGDYTIRLIINPDKLGRKPYNVDSFERVPGSFWGRGVPELMEDVQGVCNAIARSIVNNCALACLTGDTVVYRNENGRGSAYAEITLNELWEKKQQHNSGLRRIKLRSLDEQSGEFYYNRVVDIIDNGVADIFRVKTANGYTIRATSTHRFMGDDGSWRRLETFVPGDLIAVNGSAKPMTGVCVECGSQTRRIGVRCRSCASKVHNSRWNQRQVLMSRGNLDVLETTARGRHDCRSAMKSSCEKCGISSDVKSLHVHHRDRNPHNNAPINLSTLCCSCHRATHLREDSFGIPRLQKYLSFDEIISIEHVGTERVFDLAMEGPNHNFIANGFVSHNSGPQVEVDNGRCDDVEKIFPWKIWASSNKQMADGPAVRFYQPQVIIQPLLAAYQAFMMLADDQTGIPRWSHGNTQLLSGAGGTSSGLSMLMTSASRGIKEIISHIDAIVESAVQKHYDLLMIYDEDESIKGDAKVVARGSSALLAKEQRLVRTMEVLTNTLNPVDLQILGVEGRTKLLRSALDLLEINESGEILPEDEEKLRELVNAVTAQAQQMAASMGPPSGGGEEKPMDKAREQSGVKGVSGRPAPRNLDASGAPMGGMEANFFQNRAKPGQSAGPGQGMPQMAR